MIFSPPSRRFNLILLGLFALNLLPHLVEHSLVIVLLSIPCLLWRLAYEFQKIKLPSRFIKAFLICLGLSVLFFVYGELRSVEATSAALLVACSLKILDNVAYRDAMVLLFVNFLILMTGFLFTQNLAMTIFGGLDVILITSLLFQLHKGKSLKLNFWYMLRLGAKMSLAVLPLLILLFVVFPRVTTGILSNSTPKASSGFNERLEPGGVGNLALDDSTAFRVKFLNKEPSISELYWRGAVFTKTKGLNWGLDRERQRYKGLNRQISRSESQYEVTLEADYGRWIFLLENHKALEMGHWRLYQNIEVDSEDSLFFKRNLGQKLVYKAGAQRATESVVLVGDERQKYLTIPDDTPIKVKELLIDQFGDEKISAKNFKSTMAIYFGTNFKYALDLQNRDSKNLEEFLFQNKVGFCEHFAASFSFLARVAGIPSRVVVGFQGGKKNPLSDFYRISNRDAHAWSEIYDDELKKWVRVDPTSYVAPERLLLGGQIFHSLTLSELSEVKNASDYFLKLSQKGFAGYFERAMLFVDVVEQSWNEFLLGYDFEKQKDLLASLGIGVEKRSRLFLFSVLLLVSFFLIFRFYQVKKASFRLEPVDKKWLRFQSILLSAGIEKESFEGPRDFLFRCEKQLPESKAHLSAFRSYYLIVKYSKTHFKSDKEIDALLKDIKKQIYRRTKPASNREEKMG